MCAACAGRRRPRRSDFEAGGPSRRTGPRDQATRDLSWVGLQDIGLPPYGDLVTVGVHVLDAQGRLRLDEPVPAGLPAGVTFDLQGAVLQPNGCPIVLTAAFYGTAQ